MPDIQSIIDDFRKPDKSSARLEKLLKISILELPHKGAQIQFKITESRTPRFISFIYENKYLLKEVEGFKRHCTNKGCCNSNRKVIVFANKDDCKAFSNGIINTNTRFFSNRQLFIDATIIELKYGIQLYFKSEILIHGRKFLDDCETLHSPESNDSFLCYPRVVTYSQGKPETSFVGPVRNG